MNSTPLLGLWERGRVMLEKRRAVLWRFSERLTFVWGPSDKSDAQELAGGLQQLVLRTEVHLQQLKQQHVGKKITPKSKFGMICWTANSKWNRSSGSLMTWLPQVNPVNYPGGSAVGLRKWSAPLEHIHSDQLGYYRIIQVQGFL